MIYIKRNIFLEKKSKNIWWFQKLLLPLQHENKTILLTTKNITIMANYDYGFTFKTTRKANAFTKWYLILNALAIKEKKKEEIWNEIDKDGYRKAICKKGWNSNVFSALHKGGLITYNAKNHKWKITRQGNILLNSSFD